MDEENEDLILEEDGFLLEQTDDIELSIPEERNEGFTHHTALDGFQFPDWA